MIGKRIYIYIYLLSYCPLKETGIFFFYYLKDRFSVTCMEVTEHDTPFSSSCSDPSTDDPHAL